MGSDSEHKTKLNVMLRQDGNRFRKKPTQQQDVIRFRTIGEQERGMGSIQRVLQLPLVLLMVVLVLVQPWITWELGGLT